MIRLTQCGHPGKPLTTRRSKSPFPATHKEGTISCAGLLCPPTDLINILFFTVFLLILIMQDFSDYEFEKSIIRKAVKDIAFKYLRKEISSSTGRSISEHEDVEAIRRRLWQFRDSISSAALDSSLSGDDILRAFDSIIIRLKSNLSNKPTISLAVMVFALQKILKWATFSHNFRLNPQEGSRIKIFFSNCLRAGRFITGT